MGLFNRRLHAEEMQRVKSEVATLRQRLSQHDRSAIAVGELREHVAQLQQRPDPQAVVERVDALAAQLADLDRRITSVSTELANQLSELSGDIDSLAGRPPGDGPDPATVDALRDGQVRLANEQARYQIAFREDLAKLAEQLKRAR